MLHGIIMYKCNLQDITRHNKPLRVEHPLTEIELGGFEWKLLLVLF